MLVLYIVYGYKDFGESFDPIDNKFTDYLYEHFTETKFNNKKGADFLIISLRDYEIKKESREEALKEQATEFVLNMLEENLDYDFIHKITKLPIKEIERIRQEHFS